jgi:opacity protein-like surface antigen
MNRWLVSPILLCCFTGAALAADMAVLGQYQTVPVAPLYSWTGCYIGVNMGGGAAPQSRVDTLGIFAPPGTSLGDMTARGVVGGGQLGCDYQVGSFVFGLQGLLDLSGMKGSNVLPTTILVNNSFVQTVATFTGRVGYTVLPTLLLYGKFGGAFAHDIYNISVPSGEDVPFFPGTMTVAPATALSSFGGTASVVPAAAPTGAATGIRRGMGLCPCSRVAVFGVQLPGLPQRPGALHIRNRSGADISNQYQSKDPYRSVRHQSSFRGWKRVLVGAVRSLDRVAFQFREGHEGNRAPIVDIRACHADRTVRGSLLADLEDVL